MLAPDVVAFLERHNQVFLLTHRADGWPTGYPMVGTHHDGAIEFSTYRASAKVTRVLRDGRASCLVVPRDDADEPRCLWLHGSVSIGEPGESQVPRRGGQVPPVPAEIAEQVARRQADGKRCAMRIEIAATRWVRFGTPGS